MNIYTIFETINRKEIQMKKLILLLLFLPIVSFAELDDWQQQEIADDLIQAQQEQAFEMQQQTQLMQQEASRQEERQIQDNINKISNYD